MSIKDIGVDILALVKADPNAHPDISALVTSKQVGGSMTKLLKALLCLSSSSMSNATEQGEDDTTPLNQWR